MPQEPSSKELLKQFEAICKEQQYEYESIYADVQQALAMLEGGSHGPALVALACIGIGVLVGKPYGQKIIERGFDAVDGRERGE
ncbi:MAG: hypothetical protein KQJ78_15875 [Deltaproteobacteria bacterium]|nr:hypothetical protein [Deltaproteobacteria bacterium]